MYVWKIGVLGREECLGLLERLRSMVSEEEYQLSMMELKGGD